MASGDTLANYQVATRIGTALMSANSALITTVETSVLSVSVALTVGRKYAVSASMRLSSSVVNDSVLMRIREDSATGTDMQVGRIYVNDLDAAALGPCNLYAEYVAVATAIKQFHVCLTRRTGTGSVSGRAGATSPAYLYVDALPT